MRAYSLARLHAGVRRDEVGSEAQIPFSRPVATDISVVEPAIRLPVIPRDSKSTQIHDAEVTLCIGVLRQCRVLEPFGRGGEVAIRTQTEVVMDPDEIAGRRVAGVRARAE